MSTSKAELRQELLAKRRALPSDWIERTSDAIQGALETMPAFGRAREVLLYMAVRGEVRTGRLLDALLRRGARVLLPRCEPGASGIMHLACLNCREELRPGAHGILEPAPELCARAEDFSPDVAVVPGVAFDRRGFRLGYGGGYYDRLLAGPAFERTLLVAPAYAFQIVETLPADPWDRPVHRLVTENGIIEVGA